MKKSTMYDCVVTVIICAFTVARAQDVPPPPRPNNNGPNADFTMKYIQDRLNSVEIGWTEIAHADSTDIHYMNKYAITSAEASRTRCTLAFKENLQNYSLDTPTTYTHVNSFDETFSFRDVASVQVQPRSDFERRAGFSREYSPPLYALTIKMVPGKTLHLRSRGESQSEGERTEATLFFLDEDLTNRLAKAIIHAVELCEGGDKDPFK